MENSYWYRYFLVCNQLANKILAHQPQNFALLIKDEDGGRFMNSQMTRFFYAIDEYFSELTCNDNLMVFDELGIDELAELSVEQIEEDFENYCNSKMEMFKFNEE